MLCLVVLSQFAYNFDTYTKFQVMLNHFQEAFIITAKKACLSIIWQSHLCLQTPTHTQEDFAIIKAWLRTYAQIEFTFVYAKRN